MLITLESQDGGYGIAAGCTVTLVTTPCVPILLDRLLVPPSVGPHFKLSSIMVGRVDCGSDGDPVSTELFVWRDCTACGAKDAAGGAELELPKFPLLPGMQLSVTVTNTTADARPFSCTFEGAADWKAYGALGRDFRRKLPVLAEAQLLTAAYRARDLLTDKKASWPDSAREAARLLDEAIRRVEGD